MIRKAANTSQVFPKCRQLSLLVFGLIACFLFSVVAVSASAKSVNLEEVIRAVLQRSLNVEQENQSIHRAEARLRQANGKFDWRYFATIETRVESSESEFNTLLNSSLDNSVLGTTAGARKKFRNGITITPAFAIFRDSDTEADAVGQTLTGVNVFVEVPLLRGRGEQNVAAGVLSAEAALKASELSTAFAIQSLLRNAVGAFWRCLAAKQSLDLSMALDREISAINQSRRQLVSRGELAPLELQKLEADAAFRSLTNNSKRQLLLNARRNLAMALGSRPQAGQELPLAVGELPVLEGLPANFEAKSGYIELARAKRADLESLKLIAESEDILKQEARDALKPNLDLLFDIQSVKLRYTQSLNADVERGILSERSVAVHEAQLNLQLLLQAIQFDIQNVLDTLKLSSDSYRLASATHNLLQSVAKDQERQVAIGTAERSSRISTLSKISSTRRQIIDAMLQYAIGLSELRLVTGTIAVDDSRSPAQLARDFQQFPELP